MFQANKILYSKKMLIKGSLLAVFILSTHVESKIFGYLSSMERAYNVAVLPMLFSVLCYTECGDNCHECEIVDGGG